MVGEEWSDGQYMGCFQIYFDPSKDLDAYKLMVVVVGLMQSKKNPFLVLFFMHENNFELTKEKMILNFIWFHKRKIRQRKCM